MVDEVVVGVGAILELLRTRGGLGSGFSSLVEVPRGHVAVFTLRVSVQTCVHVEGE